MLVEGYDFTFEFQLIIVNSLYLRDFWWSPIYRTDFMPYLRVKAFSASATGNVKLYHI